MFKFGAMFVGWYIWHGLGVTIGYHRFLSHRSFSCNKAVEYLWTIPGYLAFQGPPLWWATMHRAHHRFVDTPLDPHSPRNGLLEGWWGWALKRHYPEHVKPEIQAKDLVKDPLYRWLDQDGDMWRGHTLNGALNALFRIFILMRFGWMPAATSMLAALTVQQVPVLLNVACHMPQLGYRNFDTKDDSVNVWWVALLAMGEGWHNNHHAVPGSAKSGLKPSEFDLSWLVIRGMEMLGMVTRVNTQTTSGALASRIKDGSEKCRLRVVGPVESHSSDEQPATDLFADESADELFWQTA
jgi:sn-1 stearoyl-lipid 9-desaturase